MWEYHQSTGTLLHNGALVGQGYSGHGAGLDNPAMEADAGVGPIPQGLWSIAAFENDHPHLGPFVAALTPVAHAAHGRSAFFMHGDNSAGNGTASHGCIVIRRPVREAVARSGDHKLTVMA